jgi:CubicO group peptidase (beta-lactamase class C family)
MRRLLTYLAAFGLLSASLAVGVVTADLPFWRRAVQLPLPADTLYLPVVEIGGDAQPAPPVAVPGVPADPAALEAAVAEARLAGSRALLVMRRGELVLARYFGADDEHTLLPAGVVARPLAAMAFGLALADRRVDALDTSVARLLPEWDGEQRGRITLRQLLDETSGLESGGETRELMIHPPWRDPGKLFEFATSRGVRLVMGNDFARTALGFELRHEPGGSHNTSPANAQLIAVILERVTGMPYERFIEQRLWRPIDGGRARLALDRRAGMPAAHCCWLASAPAMVRVASLLATDGVDRGQRILPEGWVAEMTRASRVNAEGAMQLARSTIAGTTALTSADGGNVFWVIPAKQLAILNIVNPEGASTPQLPVQLLQLLGG